MQFRCSDEALQWRQSLKIARRAMLFAIVDRRPEKAAKHARIAAHYGHLMIRIGATEFAK